MNSKTHKQIVFADSYTRKLNQSQPSLLRGMTSALDAGKDLNDLTQIIRDHYSDGYDSIELLLNKKFYDFCNQKLAMLQPYYPFELLFDNEKDKVSITANYTRHIVHNSPSRWLVDLKRLMESKQSIFGMYMPQTSDDDDSDLLSAIFDLLYHCYEARLKTLELKVDGDSDKELDLNISESRRELPFVEKVTVDEKGDRKLINIEFTEPKEYYTVEDIPLYVEMYTRPDTLESTDVCSIRQYINDARNHHATELTVSINSDRYERIRRKLDFEKLDFKVFHSDLRYDTHTDLIIKILE